MSAQGLAINGDELAIGAVMNRLHPVREAAVKFGRVETGDDACDGVMDGNVIWKQALTLKPRDVGIAKLFDIFPTFASGDNRAERKEQDVKKWIAHLGGLARIAQLTKMLAEPVDFHDDTPAKGSIRSHPDPLVKSLELLKKHS
uniref:Uncharacterized protein n=1 Tax=Escherichia coli TaxID=562 RepID=A0A6G6AL40_ECOLX|nr:hypothetical protein [Escherichia coli]QID22966.1 hypothetical protein [Escherichia coli]QID23425.1 hypothetical protein [Escherichia coli]